MAGEQNAVELITSQRSRKLTPEAFKEGTQINFLLPSGEVIKEIVIRMYGKFTPTYASGSPTTHPLGIMDALIKRIQIVTDGGQVHKSFNGVDQLRRQAKYLFGNDAASYYKANSSSLGDTPTKGFAQIGTSTQDVAFAESVSIPLENKLSSEWARTLLNLRGKNSSYLSIDTNNLTSIQTKGGAVSITYTSNITIEVSLITAPHFSNEQFEVWQQSVRTFELSGAVVNKPYELSRGGKIQGFWLTMTKGADEARINLDEAQKCRFQVVKNGKEILKDFTLADLIDENANKSKMADKIMGSGYVNFLNNSTYETALNTGRGSDVTALDLVVTSDSSLSYSPNPVRIKIEQDDIVQLS